jgi:myosin-5
MEAGTRVWSYESSGEDPWILSEIISRSDNSIKLKHILSGGGGGDDSSSEPFDRPLLKNDAADSSSEGAKYEGVELANAQLSEADIAEGMDNDMISLPHLHEPAILHAVSERYFRGEIYTWTGPVLIAVNPFQRLPLYTREILESYRQEGFIRSQNLGDSNAKPLGPHVYSVADRSYRQMMAEERKSQSILISGESGAGKTETTKIVMLYLTTLGTPEESGGPNVEVGVEELHDSNEKLSIMERVLQSNPILEAFGNAKTLRNDNSSRFGKFIELGFNRAGILQGARVQTYLLEKVRIGFHASGERNYHIFYQLLRGATEEQHHKYCFHDGLTGGLELANYFHLTGQGGAPTLREFTDEDGLKYTLKSMRSMGWDEGKIDKVLSIVAGILHLGQVKFESKMSEGGQEIAQIADEKTVADAAMLLGVDVAKLTTALTVRIMVTRGDEIRIDLAPDKAQDARDALAKTVYGALFLWVVKEVNNCIMWENDKDIRSSAGVLDIFGFESFAVNSFEQLCINFTNEALQQQFNKFIFKLEQEEYEREEISWAFISFPDNQDCLDTIQSRPKGILTMLDDECKLGQRGSDKNWAKRLNETYLPEKNQEISDNTRYSATKMQQAKGIFCVRHFAGNVAYTAETSFLEKNRDEIPLTAQTLFEVDSSDLIKEIYNVQLSESSEDTTAAKSKTVSQQFKAQLTSLIEMIETTDPHYIRCLKPNDAAKPKLLTRKRLTEQLRYGGVLEAVRVARMGYPVRMDHKGFFKRYRMLLPSISEDKLSWSAEDQDPQRLSEKLLDIVLEEGAKPTKYENEDGSISRANQIRKAQRQPDPMIFPKEDVQLGKTKIFMRKGPHDKLESHRVFHQNASITLIQSWMRMMQQNRRYLIMEDAALMIERWYRGCLGRARWWKLREAQAGQLLTNNFRMQINRRKYNKARAGTIRLQAQYRGRNTRKVNAATKIQSYYRMHVQSKSYKKLKSAIIALQCCVRRGIAKKVFEQVKREAKDMGKVKEHNEKLKAEMASLKAMLQAQAANDAGREKSEKAIKEKQAEIDRLEARIAQLEAALAKEKENVQKLENDLAAQKEGNRRLTADLQYQKEKVASTQTPKHRKQASGSAKAQQLAEAVVIGATLSSEDLAQHHAEVARLEEELEEERKMSRAMRTQIKNLRASMADKGVVDVTASTDYISDAVSEISGSEMDTSDIPDPSEVEQVRYVQLLLQGWLNECSSVLVLFERRGGSAHFPLQTSTLLRNRNGMLNQILTLYTCLLNVIFLDLSCCWC